MNDFLIEDKKYMKRCLHIARKGGGDVSTNPMVGAVIVYNGRIIGEGFHKCCGGAHAEVNAVASVSDSDRIFIPLSTMYVSLEPCCHYGKTPPCSELIIKEKIKRIVIAMQDPFPRVAGGGIAQLKKAGVDVTVGVLEQEARELNRRFITYHEKKRPYVILKWAETADGFIDSDRKDDEPAVWLTGAAAKSLVHRWRSEEDAIMVGTNTVLRDNPSLTVRNWHGRNPLRVVIDRNKRIPSTAAVNNIDADTIILKDESLEEILTLLYEKGIQSLFVEGGTLLMQSFIAKGYVDEIRRFIAPVCLNDLGGAKNGVRAPLFNSVDAVECFSIGKSKLYYYRIK